MIMGLYSCTGIPARAASKTVTPRACPTISAVVTTKAKREVQASLSRESDQREKAEATAALALEALDNIFDRLAPDRIVASSDHAMIGSGGDDFDIPVQPVLSPEAAALLEEVLAFYGRLAAEMGD